MINPFKEINWKPDRAELKKFGVSLIIGFPIIALVFFLVRWAKSGALPEPRFFLMLGGIGALSFAMTLAMFAVLPKSFQPPQDSDTSFARIEMVPGTTLQQTEVNLPFIISSARVSDVFSTSQIAVAFGMSGALLI